MTKEEQVLKYYYIHVSGGVIEKHIDMISGEILSNEEKEKITFEDSNIIVFIKEGKENTVLARIDDVYISAKDLKEELKNQEYLK